MGQMLGQITEKIPLDQIKETMGGLVEKIPMDQIKETVGNLTNKVAELNIPEKISQNMSQLANYDPLKTCRPEYIHTEDRAQIFLLQADEANEPVPEDDKLKAVKKNKLPHIPIKQFHDLNEETQKLLDQLDDKYGRPRDHRDFDYNAWQKYDPEEFDFYEYNQGPIEEDTFQILNPEDLENAQVFQGEVDPESGKRNGYGIEATNKYVRIGWWRDGEFTGWGRESRRNKDVLQGHFENGQLNGKGKYINSQDETYVGDFKDNKKHGHGVVNTKKILYNGEFVDDKMDGQGEILFKTTGNSYVGEFKKGQISGEGKCTWKNGDVYEGNLNNGIRSGAGKYSTNFGKKSVYEGQYVDGKKSGQGKLLSYSRLNKSQIYEGGFSEGKPTGGSIMIDGKTLPVEVTKEGRISMRMDK